MKAVFFVLEIIGIIAFAWSGAIVARKKEMDIFGMCVMGVTTALGGGLIRDVILKRTPTALTTPLYALIAACVALFAFFPFVQKMIEHTRVFNTILLVSDSLGLGIFTVIGINACLEANPDASIYMCVVMGVITGVGGGALRDIFCNQMPSIFTKRFYACASIMGAVACALLHAYTNEILSTVVAIMLVLTLRILAAIFHWELPKARSFYFDTTKSSTEPSQQSPTAQ